MSFYKHSTYVEREKNASKIYLTKAILFLESELELIYSRINTLKTKLSNITKNSSSDWNITDNDLIELARSLYAANISFSKGKRTTFINIVRELEVFFNMKVKRPHNKVTRISERINISPFLDFLKDSYLKDSDARL